MDFETLRIRIEYLPENGCRSCAQTALTFVGLAATHRDAGDLALARQHLNVAREYIYKAQEKYARSRGE